MKRKKFSKGLVVAVLLIAIMLLGSVVAYLTDADTATNTFTVGGISINLQEPNWKPSEAKEIVPNFEVAKDPQIINDGSNPAYVFLEVKVPYGDLVTADKETGERVVSKDTELWSYDIKDGWVEVGTPTKNTEDGTISHIYVYGTVDNCTVLDVDAITPTLFDYVKFANVIEDQGLENATKDIVVNAYAIQTDNIYDGKTNLDGDNSDGKVNPLEVLEVISNQFPTIDDKVHLGAMLMAGSSFNATIPETATAVVFCNEVAPEDATLTDVSEAQDNGVVAWMDGSTYKVSTQDASLEVLANSDSSKMFYNKPNLESLTFDNFDSYYTTNMKLTFGCDNPSKATNISSLDLTGWDVSNVTNMEGTFYSCLNLTSLDVSNWNTGNVETMGTMFLDTKKLKTIDVSNWDVSNVENFYGMFGTNSYPSELKFVDVSKWDTSSATNMSNMFFRRGKLKNIDVSNWDTSNVTNMQAMFYDCVNLENIDVSNWDTSNVTNMKSTFGAYNGDMLLEEIDVSNWDTSKVTNMRTMFQRCKNLISLDVSNWNTSKVTDMGLMFNKCCSLTSLDVSNWDTSKVNNMKEMFSYCGNLRTLDVSDWNVSNVTTFYSMFNKCYSLDSVDTSSWNTSSAINMSCMFSECTSLTELDLSNFNTDNVKGFKSMFDGCFALRKLDIFSFNTSSVLSSGSDSLGEFGLVNMFNGASNIEEIHLGEKFSFVSSDGLSSCTLPTPHNEEGKWYNQDGVAFAPIDIPNNTAATYFSVRQ